MEPAKTHVATLPQQDLTRPAEGCPSGPRTEDLVLEGHEGANPHVGQRVAEILDVTITPKKITNLDLFKLLENRAHLRGQKLRPLDIPENERTTTVLNALYPKGIPDYIHRDFYTVKNNKAYL